MACASPRVARHYNAASFGPDGMLYVAGAFRHLGYNHSAERYDAVADAWESLPDVSTELEFTAGAFLL